MLSCWESESLLARYADAESRLTEGVRLEIGAHVASCAACRASLEEQRKVRDILGAREPSQVAAGFAARLSARIDREGGAAWLDLANWRVWSAGLVPLAASLLLVAYLDAGSSTSSTSGEPSGSSSSSSQVAEASNPLDLWPTSPDQRASVLLQSASNGDLLLETILTGAVPATSGEPANVR